MKPEYSTWTIKVLSLETFLLYYAKNVWFKQQKSLS